MGRLEGQKEPVTSAANVDPKAIGMIFCPAASNLCITGWVGNTPMAMSNANYFSEHLKCFPGRIDVVAEEFANDPGTLKFAHLQKDISEFELSTVLDILEIEGIDVNNVAHRSGLMVLEEYSGKGYAKRMIMESDRYLRSQDIEAVVVSPSWEGSRNIFLSQGYKIIGKFQLKDYGINLDDYNSYMIKIF